VHRRNNRPTRVRWHSQWDVTGYVFVTNRTPEHRKVSHLSNELWQSRLAEGVFRRIIVTCRVDELARVIPPTPQAYDTERFRQTPHAHHTPRAIAAVVYLAARVQWRRHLRQYCLHFLLRMRAQTNAHNILHQFHGYGRSYFRIGNWINGGVPDWTGPTSAPRQTGVWHATWE